MHSRQVPVYSGILFLSCVWIHGVDSKPKVITATSRVNQNTTVQAGSDVVLECTGAVSDRGTWYKTDKQRDYIAYVELNKELCNITQEPVSLPGLSLGNEDCAKHALKISNISKEHEGTWTCQIEKSTTQKLHVHVVASATESTSHVTATAGVPGSTPDATTESTAPATDTNSAGYTTEGRTQDSVNPQTPSVTSMTTILGGTVGGALVLLAAILTVCCLLRSKKEKQNNGSREPVNGDHRHQDPEQREDAGMVDNVLYDSYGGDVGQAAKHQDPLVLAGRSQPDSVVGDIYAIPDKQRTSTLNAESPDRSQLDSVVVDIYAIPDKQRTSTLNEGAAAGDVYSVVQKQPKSEGETMPLQSTDKDAEMSELYSQVQKPQKNGK
ncbi:uncharacterized protein LOC124261731 isoform X2 [Haliotis rubra]|uniref:uncharacterized protein LOC124261731 isoform X2 n=1 Tax=Haliotis rubra TaxID=36100 RepID=UPI001EE513B8|nr:uncharacterized protein LOC124261731 isoform X2 [Haliotis rubra]